MSKKFVKFSLLFIVGCMVLSMFAGVIGIIMGVK